MKKECRARLECNRTYLLETLEVDPVVDLCLQGSALCLLDVERIRAERSRPDRVQVFLNILATKPDDASYDTFRRALDDVSVKQPFVGRQLDRTELSDDVREDTYQRVLVEQILKEHFTPKKDAKCSKAQMMRILRNQLRRQKTCLVLSEEDVVGLARAAFPQAGFRENKKGNVCTIFDVEAKEATAFLDPEEPNVLHPLGDVTEEKVAKVMKTVLESHGLDGVWAKRLDEMEIDGKALELMEKDDVKSMYPELKPGKVIRFMECVKIACEELKKQPVREATNIKEPVIPRKLETFRSFDTQPTASDVYEKGHVLPQVHLRPGNLLQPIHKFCVFTTKASDGGQSEIGKELGSEVVQFASACLNERVNGTIHFGVVPECTGGHQDGEIVGINIGKRECEQAITDEIYRRFFPDQIEMALSCIRESMCVPVVKKDDPSSNLFVVEVDVIPHSEVVKDAAFFLKPKTEGIPLLYRFVQGRVVSVEGKCLQDFMDHKKSLTALRKETETEFQRSLHREDLHRKLHYLLTGGTDYRMADIYPVLFLSPCPKTATGEYLSNFRCLKSLDPLAVFDFDPLVEDSSDQPLGLYTMMERQLEQVHKTLTTDNFDENSEENKACGNESGLDKLFEDIRSSSLRTWIFCNGYGPLGKKELPPAGWTRSRALGFKEAVRFYKKLIPTENARILIFALSKSCDVFISALEEVFANFPDQWILIAESENDVQELSAEIVRRGYVEKEVFEDRSVIGMPWSHVNQSIMNIFGCTSATGCKLTSSSGTSVLLKERKKNEWSDLDILSMNECSEEADDMETNGGEDDLGLKSRRTEEDFYRGAQVSWWNFFFKSHVLERDQAKELQERVEEYLTGKKIPKDERVGVVTLLHQPGAGATTIARQVLWKLRDKYRCCVVKQITDQTSDHIASLRGFEEKHSALPPLILADNVDFEKVCQLRSKLNEKARRQARGDKAVQQVFCVLIVCRRIAGSFKKGRHFLHQDRLCVYLDHELKPEDIQWFQRKYKDLEARYKEKQGLNPKLLFSFNILKENFSKRYMQRTVDEFIGEIEEDREKKFLKFVALINTFDVEFQTIPMSCFNAIMCPKPDQRKARAQLEKMIFTRGNINWASSLSKSLNVLLNRTSKPFCGKGIKAIRIVNNNLSKEILENLRKREKDKVSDVMMELLCSDIFKRGNESTVQNQLVKLVKDVLKTRVATRTGRQKFSPIILEIGEREGYVQAAKVLETAFDLFEDPMLAQQIARVFIHMEDFDKAQHFAQIATDMDPTNFYLCDTLGQVFKGKLLCLWDKVMKSKESLEGEKVKEILDVAFTAIDIFRTEQNLSDEAVNLDYTNCGSLFELQIISTVIDICRFLQPFKNDTALLHKFFVNKKFCPQEVEHLLGKENVQKLKRLYVEHEKPLKRLEDEEVQLKDDPAYQGSISYIRNAENCHMLSKVKVRLLAIFGEDTDDVPAQLREEEACDYRRRIVMKKGGTSYFAVRKLREERDADKKLERLYNMMYENVHSQFCSAADLRSLLNLTVARISLGKAFSQTLSVSDAMKWAMQLYQKTEELAVHNVEACLYLLMFHWPTEWRKQNRLPLCPCTMIKEGIERWKQAFLENHPAQKQRKKPDRRKPTTLFFLGQGEGFQEIVFHNEFDHLQSTDGESIWDREEVKYRLKQLPGTLHYGGKSISVKVASSDDAGIRLDICTSLPITDKALWNRPVRFVLGFSWSGPKAYDVKEDTMEAEKQNPAEAAHPTASKVSEATSSSRPSHDEMVDQEDRYWQEHKQIVEELQEIEVQARKTAASRESTAKLTKRRQELEKRLDDLTQRRKNVFMGTD